MAGIVLANSAEAFFLPSSSITPSGYSTNSVIGSVSGGFFGAIAKPFELKDLVMAHEKGLFSEEQPAC